LNLALSTIPLRNAAPQNDELAIFDLFVRIKRAMVKAHSCRPRDVAFSAHSPDDFSP